jgi:transcriptional regulator with PAS, ATPase and Fis domain
MTEPAAAPDELRWPALFRRAREPLFILNHRRRIIFANAAWEYLTKTSIDEAKTLTCTTRETGHDLAGLGVTLSPTPEVLAGHAASVCRPQPNHDSGPPWWDIDFVPIMGDGQLIGVLGRIRQMEPAPTPAKSSLPAAWVALRQKVQQQFSLTLWESAVPAVHRMVGQARLVASAACPAVLVGEPGTGKRTLARTIHALSARRELPCVSLACDRLPADVVRATIGQQPAALGMLYLQAPAALPRDLQADIVRTLVDKTHVILGCPADPMVDVREGRLAEELWAAISTVVIAIPPLRERLGDLPRLAGILLQRAGEAIGRSAVELTPAAIENLGAHLWSGNLDELHEVLQTAAARCDQPAIDVGDLPLALREQPEGTTVRETLPPLDQMLERVEARMIRLALGRAGGNKTKAAELLGIWRPRLLRRMEALGITDAETD